MTDTIYFIVIGVVGLITALLILTAISDEKEVRAITVASKSKQRKALKTANFKSKPIKKLSTQVTKKALTKRYKRTKVESWCHQH